MKLDHRSLLVRYIRHVTGCDGTSFICRIGGRKGGVKFTEEEVIELKALEKEGVGVAASDETTTAFTVGSLPSDIAVGESFREHGELWYVRALVDDGALCRRWSSEKRRWHYEYFDKV